MGTRSTTPHGHDQSAFDDGLDNATGAVSAMVGATWRGSLTVAEFKLLEDAA